MFPRCSQLLWLLACIWQANWRVGEWKAFTSDREVILCWAEFYQLLGVVSLHHIHCFLALACTFHPLNWSRPQPPPARQARTAALPSPARSAADPALLPRRARSAAGPALLSCPARSDLRAKLSLTHDTFHSLSHTSSKTSLTYTCSVGL